MISLTKSEFCNFNLNSRLSLTRKDGKLLTTKHVTNLTCALYMLYDFHVELIYDTEIDEIIKINPINSVNWVDFYFDSKN